MSLGPTKVQRLISKGIIWFSYAAVGILLFIGLTLSSCHTIRAAEVSQMQLPEELRREYRNPDGSCVQCSIGMTGAHNGCLPAAYLLERWDGQPAERGGSYPSRVAEYCDRRGIQAWNVTANSPEKTAAWAKWACQTGRFAAVGLNRAHFQTCYGYDPTSDKPWLVCDNNSTSRIDRYSHEEFIRRHVASGPWVVVLKQPAPDPPQVREWWK